MQAAVGRMALRMLRLREAQAAHGKDKVFQAGQAVAVDIRIKCSVKKQTANLSEVKVARWGRVENKLI